MRDLFGKLACASICMAAALSCNELDTLNGNLKLKSLDLSGAKYLSVSPGEASCQINDNPNPVTTLIPLN